MTLYLDDIIVASELSIRDAYCCVDRTFRLIADGAATNMVRQRSQAGTAVMNVMWALAPTEGIMGVKAYPVVRQDVSQASVLTLLLYAIDTGELLAVIKADRLSQIRTGAATAVATKTMARSDAEVLAVYGAGWQAEAQIKALVSAMPQLTSVRVVGRDLEHRDSFIARMRQQIDIDVQADEPEAAARIADVIVTATGSADPVIRGSWLKEGTHINAVGSNIATKREVDRAVLERAALILVDDRDVAKSECGDLIANGWDAATVGTIGELLTGRIPGRSRPEAITVFQSQGVALQDVVCGGLIVQKATEKGLGLRIA